MKKDNLRWVEDTAHLRRVGYADEIADIRHTGWFTDDFQEETYRGVVFRLPKLRGYLVGYEDPNNDGAALLQFCDADSDTEAARMADHIAEWEAREECDYQRVWHATSDLETAAQQVADAAETRGDALTYLRSLDRRATPVNFLLAIRAYRSAAEEFCDAIGRFGRIDTPYELNPDFDLDLINRAQAIA